MKFTLTRDLALKLHFIFDQLLPPVLRDCRWVMIVPLRILFRNRYKYYLDFKDTAFALSEAQFRDMYRITNDTAVKRETDLNHASIASIMAHVTGPTALDVGCGRGFLADLLSRHPSVREVSAIDIVVSPAIRERFPQVTFYEENVESLPFADKSFDTVVCTHTLEHVRNMHLAVAELRRVAKKLIIVVPRQRPYKYTFDLHLNFFPYLHSLLSIMGKTASEVICEDADGDIFYVEQCG